MTKDTANLVLLQELLDEIKAKFEFGWVGISFETNFQREPVRGHFDAKWTTFARILSIELASSIENSRFVIENSHTLQNRCITLKVELEVVKRDNSDGSNPIKYVLENRTWSIRSCRTDLSWFTKRIKTAVRRGRLLFHDDFTSSDGLLVQLLTAPQVGKLVREVELRREALAKEVEVIQEQNTELLRMQRFLEQSQK